MTQEDKELLLQDLCARLLYGVKVTTTNPAAEFGIMSGISSKSKISVSTKDADIVFECTEVKPYFRPMSSMTEEEKKEFHHIASLQRNYLGDDIFYTHWQMYDWLNKNMFDYRGLIVKGLALVAPDDMYEINKK